ncbi:hypothetical protein [Lacipirellula sp.]|uniref:hypothetical protein n=1 Tax=Lacipirellula sp. TaxID=2691419 RepID=UPI003D10B596
MHATDAIYKVSRIFAELPYTDSWLKICHHAERLERVEITAFDSNGEGTWLRFTYADFKFAVGEYNERIRLTVNDGNCPPDLLIEVTEHFAALLSPHMQQC